MNKIIYKIWLKGFTVAYLFVFFAGSLSAMEGKRKYIETTDKCASKKPCKSEDITFITVRQEKNEKVQFLNYSINYLYDYAYKNFSKTSFDFKRIELYKKALAYAEAKKNVKRPEASEVVKLFKRYAAGEIKNTDEIAWLKRWFDFDVLDTLFLFSSFNLKDRTTDQVRDTALDAFLKQAPGKWTIKPASVPCDTQKQIFYRTLDYESAAGAEVNSIASRRISYERCHGYNLVGSEKWYPSLLELIEDVLGEEKISDYFTGFKASEGKLNIHRRY